VADLLVQEAEQEEEPQQQKKEQEAARKVDAEAARVKVEEITRKKESWRMNEEVHHIMILWSSASDDF